jgi:hypothetical protein
MTIARRMLSLAVLSFVSLSAGPADAPPSPISAFDPFVGEWTVDAKWDSGVPLKARATYTPILGGKHIRTATYLPTEKGEIQRYDGVLTYHHGRKSLVSYSFSVDGEVGETLVETADGKTFLFGFTPWDPAAPSKLRQTLQIKNADTFSWLVEMQQDGKWQRLILADWKRAK